MVKVRIGDDLIKSKIKSKVRFDYKGEDKPGKFLFGGKPMTQAAEENREEQVALLCNLPVRGITVEECDTSLPAYIANDDSARTRIAYAPAILTILADSIEDIISFVTCEEFRKIEIIEPSELVLSSYDLERVLFCVNDEFKKQVMVHLKNIRR